MKLHVTTLGSGPDLVLLHGWALHGGVWDATADRLARQFRLTVVDLPGHGKSAPLPGGKLADYGRAVLDVAPERAVWLGWSLGGMVALRAALDAPGRIDGLLSVASTPRFTTAPDWPHATRPATVERFAAELQRDYRSTVEQFLALQVLGDDRARPTLRKLRDIVFDAGEPDPAALADGLAILHDSDLRAELDKLACPLLAIMGEYDRLTPPDAGRALAAAVPDGAAWVVERAAHAPFLSHPEDFERRVTEFIERIGAAA